jgi:hypothetical protein
MAETGLVLAEEGVLQQMLRNLGKSMSSPVMKKWMKFFRPSKNWPTMLPSDLIWFMINAIERGPLVERFARNRPVLKKDNVAGIYEIDSCVQINPEPGARA